jgi:HTH-type transcriptional regulator / antitoxin HipB
MHSTPSNVAREIGMTVTEERNRLALTQAELAFIAGVSTRVVHQVENGKETSRLDSIVAILDALGLALVVAADSVDSEAR